MGALRRHWRASAAFLLGCVAAAAALAAGRNAALSVVLGADAGAALFLAATGRLIARDGEADLRRRAREDDPSGPAMMALVLGAMGVSLVALVFALREGRSPGHPASGWLAALAVTTLAESWLVVQMLFCLRYAHLYFGDVTNGDDDGPSRGVRFEGEPPRSYREFWYMAVCMGATYQVSDFPLTTTRFRDAVTVHALVAFAFNTLVLALGVGIVGAILG